MKNKKNNLNNEYINKINDENDLLIERNIHYCNRNKDKDKDIDKNEIIKNDNESTNEENSDKIKDESNKEINYNRIINKPEFIEASKNVLNNLKIKLKDDEKKEE